MGYKTQFRLLLCQYGPAGPDSTSDYNAFVVALLGIYLPLPLLASSSHIGRCLSCAVIEHIRFYLFVLPFIIKCSNTVTCNLEQMAVLYHGPLFNQPG